MPDKTVRIATDGHLKTGPVPYCDTQVTDANGVATFTLPAGYFKTVTSVDPTVLRDVANGQSAHVRSKSISTVVVQASESKTTAINLLGINVLGLQSVPAGVSVMITVHGT